MAPIIDLEKDIEIWPQADAAKLFREMILAIEWEKGVLLEVSETWQSLERKGIPRTAVLRTVTELFGPRLEQARREAHTRWTKWDLSLQLMRHDESAGP